MQHIRCDVAVIGGGAAAMRAAIAAHDSGADTVIVSKQTPGYSGNSVIARSGHSAPFGTPELADTPELFVADSSMPGDMSTTSLWYGPCAPKPVPASKS